MKISTQPSALCWHVAVGERLIRKLRWVHQDSSFQLKHWTDILRGFQLHANSTHHNMSDRQNLSRCCCRSHESPEFLRDTKWPTSLRDSVWLKCRLYTSSTSSVTFGRALSSSVLLCHLPTHWSLMKLRRGNTLDVQLLAEQIHGPLFS